MWIIPFQQSYNDNEHSFSRERKPEKSVTTEGDSPALHNHSPDEHSSLSSPVGQRDYDIPASSLRQKLAFG